MCLKRIILFRTMRFSPFTQPLQPKMKTNRTGALPSQAEGGKIGHTRRRTQKETVLVTFYQGQELLGLISYGSMLSEELLYQYIVQAQRAGCKQLYIILSQKHEQYVPLLENTHSVRCEEHFFVLDHPRPVTSKTAPGFQVLFEEGTPSCDGLLPDNHEKHSRKEGVLCLYKTDTNQRVGSIRVIVSAENHKQMFCFARGSPTINVPVNAEKLLIRSLILYASERNVGRLVFLPHNMHDESIFRGIGFAKNGDYSLWMLSLEDTCE